ncbi:MAG: hypothetical protein ACRD3T_21880, partial [Terriglobia bacterium]
LYADDALSIGGTVDVSGGNGAAGGAGGAMTCPYDFRGSYLYSCTAGGGGGGGAGGNILMSSPVGINVTGTLKANGGLGGAAGVAPPDQQGNHVDGQPGGAGGGGKILALSPQTAGISRSPGTAAQGLPGFGTPSTSLGPRVASISFNFDPSSSTSDGLRECPVDRRK